MPNITYSPGVMVATPDGGDPVSFELGDMSFIYLAGVLVMIMAAGVGYLYSGLLRRKNALSMLFMCLAVYSVAAVQWMLCGYSLAFSDGASAFIGNLQYGGLVNVLDAPSIGNTRIPALLYAFYQLQFAAVTPVIAFGGVAERGRIGPMLIVAFFWCTLVYDPVACWTWNAAGWSYKLGALDFAGGGPVHITSGTAALAYSIFLGRRKGHGTPVLAYKPHSINNVVLGTTLLWFGWFGFNGGSELAMNLRAVQAGMVTNLAAAIGGLTWVAWDYRAQRKFSTVGLCSGIVAGLVGITPAAGYVGSPAALAIGVVTATACNWATALHRILRYDDALDIFALHGVGGYVGACLTGLFADSRVTGFNGVTEIPGGWINQNYIQLGYQLADATAIMGWSLVVTYCLLVIVNLIPGCKIRAPEEAEDLGMDLWDHGEMNYDYNFVELEPSHDDASSKHQSTPAVSMLDKNEGRATVTAASDPEKVV